MGRLEFTSPRDAWGGEATAFTPLLADLLDYLGEETGIGPLSRIDVEHATAGSRSLDILAETEDGRRVAIENQYKSADHDHLTRGLAYAVATQAKALVVIAEDHRDEFVAVADYLNDVGGIASSGIGVWLVKVRAVRRQGDTIWSPEFVVQAEPNEWVAAVRTDTTPRFASLEEFYQKCSDETDEAWEATAREIIADWLNRPDAAEAHDTKSSVALYYPSPQHMDTGTNVLQVQTNGSLVVCRGFIWQTAGVFPRDEDPGALDEQIAKFFPDAHWPPKKSFIRDHETDPERVSGFADWLTSRFDLARNPEPAAG